MSNLAWSLRLVGCGYDQVRKKSKAPTFVDDGAIRHTVLHQHRRRPLEYELPVCEVEGCAFHTSGCTQPSVLFASRALTMVGVCLQVPLLCVLICLCCETAVCAL